MQRNVSFTFRASMGVAIGAFALSSSVAHADDPTPPAAAPSPAAAAAKEEICNDGLDNDGDTVIDCGDADCASEARCVPDGKPESSNERCSDWVDNDKDGIIDCEDKECERLPVCSGSWRGDVEGAGGDAAGGAGGDAAGGAPSEPRRSGLPGEVEAADSEDGLGFVGVRFGVVAQAVQSFTVDNKDNEAAWGTRLDTRFERLQLRAFGNLPLLEDSFFLINIAAQRSPRISFVMFQFPLGAGHYINMNSGGGTLSNQLIISTAKLPLLETADYMLRPFEQGNSVSMELSGPIIPNVFKYRIFGGGGAGIPGVVGGRFLRYDDINYTYTAGAQTQFVPVGYYNRFENPFLFRPVPMALALTLGAKYEQRALERFPAVNAQAVFRWGIFELYLESYSKADINFGAVQTANNMMLGLLLWPETLFVAADIGHFWTSDFGFLEQNLGYPVVDPPANLRDLANQKGQIQARAALHWYFWRQNGILSLRYLFDQTDGVRTGVSGLRLTPIATHDFWLSAQFRF